MRLFEKVNSPPDAQVVTNSPQVPHPEGNGEKHTARYIILT